MRCAGGFLIGLFAVFGLATSALGQSGVQWHPDFEGAKAHAARGGQLVMAYFWAPWCPVCTEMERDVFSRPGVAASIHVAFIPVKINHDQAPALARHYGIRGLPAIVVVSADGTPLDRVEGRIAPEQLAQRLNRLAAQTQRSAQAPPAVAYRPAVNQPPAVPPVGQLAGQPPVGQPPAGPPFAGPPPSPVALGPRDADGVSRTPSVEANPPLALDGYCAVSLSDDLLAGQRRWMLGNRAHGVIHRERTYLFASGDKAARFFQEPDRYAPVLSGDDVVAAVDESHAVTGKREHGAFFGGRVYLFSSEETLQRFENNPNRYADAVLRLSSRSVPPR